MERLTREWKANYWKRLHIQMHAALKRMADVDDLEDDSYSEDLGNQWASLISELSGGVENPDIHVASLFDLRRWIADDEKSTN